MTLGVGDYATIGGIGLANTALSYGLNYLTGQQNAEYSREAAYDNFIYNGILQQRAQDFSAEQYAKRYQTTVSDLKAAGLNPLLAVGGLSAAGQPSSGASSVGVSPARQGDTQFSLNSGLQFRTALEELKASKAESEARIAEAKVRQKEADVDETKADIEKSVYDGININVGESATATAYRDMIRNSVEREAYTRSKEHAIAEDAINAIHGINSAASAFDVIRNRKRR